MLWKLRAPGDFPADWQVRRWRPAGVAGMSIPLPHVCTRIPRRHRIMERMTRTEPLLLVFLLISLIGLFRTRKRSGILMPAVGVLGLFLLSWPPVDWLLSRPLETWYPQQPFPAGSADAIVVLSAGVSPPQYERPYSLADHDTYERCEFAAWLYNHWRHLPILACGGSGEPGQQPFALTMRQLLERAGVPGGMIWTEERSQDTHQNAAYGAEILRSHGVRSIALVTEAHDMLRAARSFKKQNLLVVPAPCSFRQFGSLTVEMVPSWKAVHSNERILHESAGLAWYWIRGWI